MNRTAILSGTLLIVFCLSVGQILLSFASYTHTEIYASGIVIYPPSVRNHVIAYVGGFTDEDAEFIASHFEIVVTGFETTSTISKIKALKPDIIILGYKDIIGMHPDYCEDWAEADSHEDWFLHDTNGNRLKNKYWDFYAMDVGNPSWRSHYANYVKDKLDSFPYDGVFADDTWDQFRYDAWTVAPSDIPAEIGQRWHSDMVGMISFVKSTIGNKLLIVNSKDNDDYVDASDGKMDEAFAHTSWWSLDNFRDEYYDWKGRVESLRNISQKGKYYLAHSGTIIPENPTEADLGKVHDVMMYCFASYLLGTSGEKASFGFNMISSKDGSRGYYSEFDVSLGSPVNEYYSIGSVYARDFTDGKVLVNPTQSSYTVSLKENHKTLDGQIVSTITLTAHAAIILLNM